MCNRGRLLERIDANVHFRMVGEGVVIRKLPRLTVKSMRRNGRYLVGFSRGGGGARNLFYPSFPRWVIFTPLLAGRMLKGIAQNP